MRVYNDLKSQLLALIDRTDYIITDPLDSNSTIDLADQWIERAVRQFYETDASRVGPFELSITGTIAEGTDFLTIPGDWRETRRIVVTRDNLQCVLEPTTSDELFSRNTTAECYIPQHFAREGGRYYVERVTGDVSYTMYYYGVLAAIDTITTENYAVTVANYMLGRATRVTAGTANAVSLFFPTGTTGAQADTNFRNLTPTLAATTDNTVEFEFTGNRINHWLLNNAGEILMYLAACEAAKYYDAADPSIQIWSQRANEQLARLVKEDQRRDGSGTTPRMRRPEAYNARSLSNSNYGGL